MSAKHAERDGDTKGAKTAHKSAHYSHMAAAEGTTGKARKYHRKMAKFHGGRAGDDAGRCRGLGRHCFGCCKS